MHADPNNSLKGGSKSGSTKPLIVTRGLQAILDKDLRKRDADAATTTKTTKKKKLVGPPGTAPKFVLCYLCGRQFGSASIDIHRPQCYLKKMIEWERTGTGIRGPRPVDPETHERQMKERLQAQAAAGDGRSAVAGSKMSDSDAYNAMQMDAFNTNGLMPCPNCGRTFLPDRLQVHLRSCRPGTTSKPVRKAAAKTTTTTTSSSSPTSSSPAPAAAAVADATAPPPPAPNTTAAERPIASSGKYVVPEGADADATPTTTTTTTKNVAAAANTSTHEESSTQDPRSPSPSSAKANTSVERSSEAPTSPPQETPEKKIKFNNVSHFKNVQSKLQLNKKASSPPCGGGDEVVEMPGAPSSSAAGLIPCKHCGRTFNPDRVVKHESVCADRNKPTTTTTTTTKKPAEIKSKKAAPAKKATTKAAATTTTTAKAKPTTTTTEVKAATSAAVSTEATPSPERSADVVAQVSPRTSAVAFCGDCGAKLTASGQKFCNACGERLPAPTE